MQGKSGSGCHYGDGSKGGSGGKSLPKEGRLVSDGGDGGRGFQKEILIIELENLVSGEEFTIEIGKGGGGGDGGLGFENGESGADGKRGYVLFVPLISNDK